MAESDRYYAARILSVAASDRPSMLSDIAHGLGINPKRHRRILALARRVLSRCTDAGNWREARAEAEARLRVGGAA